MLNCKTDTTCTDINLAQAYWTSYDSVHPITKVYRDTDGQAAGMQANNSQIHMTFLKD